MRLGWFFLLGLVNLPFAVWNYTAGSPLWVFSLAAMFACWAMGIVYYVRFCR